MGASIGGLGFRVFGSEDLIGLLPCSPCVSSAP